MIPIKISNTGKQSVRQSLFLLYKKMKKVQNPQHTQTFPASPISPFPSQGGIKPCTLSYKPKPVKCPCK